MHLLQDHLLRDRTWNQQPLPSPVRVRLAEDPALALASVQAAVKSSGVKAEDVQQLKPEMFRARAEDRVALGLILAELVREHGLQARPEQVKALVTEAAQTYEQPDAVVRWHYEKQERLNEFEALAVERNVVDWVLRQAKVTQDPVTFADMMATGRDGR